QHLYTDSRQEIFERQRLLRREIYGWLAVHFKSGRAGKNDAAFLGIDPNLSFEVHTARIAFRTRPDGGLTPQLIVGLLQSTTMPVDPKEPKGPRMSFEG